MDKILLKQKVGKWNDACRFLKGHQADLSTAEWSAVELLADFWRTRKFGTELVEESKDLIATLVAADKLHSNNRDIITWSKEFRGIAKTMYTENAANFAEFQEAMRAFAQEHAPRQRAPQPQPQRPQPQPRQPEPRPTPQPRRPQPQPRPNPTPPPPRRATLRVTGVEFRNVDVNGNQVGTGVVDGSERIFYLRPLVNCQILEPSESKDVWYKIFTPGGKLLSGDSSRAGYTWHGVVNGRQDGWTTLGGFGSDSGGTFTEQGWYRVEFYENDVKVFESRFYVAAAPVRPEPRPQPRPVNQPPRPQPRRRDEPPAPRPRKRRVKLWMIVAAIVVGWYLVETLGPVVAVLFSPVAEATEGAAADGNGETYYVFADELILRSSKVARSATNQRAILPYGTKVEVESVADGWADVRANGQEGYVSPDYLLDEADFQLLEGVFFDADSRQVVEKTRERLALLDFLKRKGLKTGKGGAMLVGVKNDLYEDDVWKGLLKVNNWVTDCFAFVLTVEGQAERPLAVYNMSVDGKPELLYETTTTKEGALWEVRRKGGDGAWEYVIGDRRRA